MRSLIRTCITLMLVLSCLTSAPSNLKADHVVTPQDLQSAIQTASQNRQQSVEQIQKFLESKPARAAMDSLKVDPQKITNAIPMLSDEELARLSTQANQAQMNFAAGYIGEHDLIVILIIILLVVAIIAIAK